MNLDVYTERAKLALGRADSAAREYGHDRVEPEHVLLGLMATSGGAMDVLTEFGVDLYRIRDEIERLGGVLPQRGPRSEPRSIGSGRAIDEIVDDLAEEVLKNVTEAFNARPISRASESVLQSAREEASTLGHDYVGTEHLLLGVLCRCDVIAARVLGDQSVRLADVRERVRSFSKPENGWTWPR